MSQRRPQKHVIFLGAGASLNSGYPLANELRLLLSSPTELSNALRQVNAETASTSMVEQFVKGFSSAVELFRDGGFATVDEFCKLASKTKEFLAEVNAMRRFTALVLAIANPEDQFQKSDYYPFVQRLFDDSLHKFRSQITVLSFNYDPYLEFLLLRAAKVRGRVARAQFTATELNAASGGLLDIPAWIKADFQTECFSVCKLHGSIAVAQNQTFLCHAHLFTGGVASRLKAAVDFGFTTPFIAFPWELFDDSGRLCSNEAFPEIGYAGLGHGLFTATWNRARAACMGADKISFVGISMHGFLERGFAFLFGDRTQPPKEIVIANKDSIPPAKSQSVVNSYTRTLAMLRRTAPKIMSSNPDSGEPFEVRSRANFREFIEHEMESD